MEDRKTKILLKKLGLALAIALACFVGTDLPKKTAAGEEGALQSLGSAKQALFGQSASESPDATSDESDDAETLQGAKSALFSDAAPLSSAGPTSAPSDGENTSAPSEGQQGILGKGQDIETLDGLGGMLKSSGAGGNSVFDKAGDAVCAPSPGMEDLGQTLIAALSGYQGNWSVYVEDLEACTYLEINSHMVKSASLIKLYVLGALLQAVENGTLAESAYLDGLMADMITVSDNDATNVLTSYLSADESFDGGMAVVNAFVAAQGFSGTHMGRSLGSYAGATPERDNYTSVHDCGTFLAAVYRGNMVSRDRSDQILNLLKAQTRTWKIPAGVPAGTVTANKTGELDDTENDAAIIFSPGGDYVLCVMATGLANVGTAQSQIAALSGMVYQYFNR